MAPVRNRKPSTKAKERLAADAVDQAQLITQDGSAVAGAQLQPLVDLITSLLKAIEEQKQAHATQIEEQQQAHARRIREQKQTLDVSIVQYSVSVMFDGVRLIEEKDDRLLGWLVGGVRAIAADDGDGLAGIWTFDS
jgi:hypothetical protein